MLKTNYLICYIGIGLILLISCAQNSFGQNTEKDFLDQKIEWRGEESSTFSWFCSLLAAKGIPVGIEQLGNLSNSENKISIHTESGTLREILNSFIKQNNKYNWEVNDNVINIYPVKSRNTILEDILSFKFQEFPTKTEWTRIQIADQIRNDSKIINFLNERKETLGITFLDKSNSSEKIVITSTSNFNLKAILNKIVKNSSYKYWSAQYIDNGGILIIFF